MPLYLKNDKVFIVHGTDRTSLAELKTLLVNAGLKPIILHEQPSKGMTLIEKLEKYSDVDYAFVLLTPDDNGLGKIDLLEFLNRFFNKTFTSMDEINISVANMGDVNAVSFLHKMFAMFKNRARQNVVLEFGYFIGRLGRSRVCCLYTGDIELPSDMQGICYLHFTNSVNEVKETIFKELEASGYEIIDAKRQEAKKIFSILNNKYYAGNLLPSYDIMFDEKTAQGRIDPKNLVIHMMENFANLNLEETNFEDALKHEMVHAELFRRGLSDWGEHNEDFKNEAKRIGAPYYH
jgi:predicted nucleotide-binding protein